jgi:hypothetical protein
MIFIDIDVKYLIMNMFRSYLLNIPTVTLKLIFLDILRNAQLFYQIL